MKLHTFFSTEPKILFVNVLAEVEMRLKICYQ